ARRLSATKHMGLFQQPARGTPGLWSMHYNIICITRKRAAQSLSTTCFLSGAARAGVNRTVERNEADGPFFKNLILV
ncbi:MAG: hypothetical protein ACREQ7_12410, partial [Candidatus Binatia bacterium]